MQETLIATDAGPAWRARLARLVLSDPFQRVVIGLILLNAVALGLETSDAVMAEFGGLLRALDRILLWLFSAELVLRIVAFRGRFFRDPWGLFDLVVVGIAWVPAAGPLAVLRALRVLRVLRLISAIPSLRNVVEAMLAALPGMGSIVMLMALIFYVFAVMATKLYGDVLPEKFGTLGASFFTLFQLMTLEGWVDDIVLPAMADQPFAWLFFIPFILLATFVVLNLFIGVIVESIQSLREQREAVATDAAAAAQDRALAAAQAQAATERALILAELRALRAEVATLRQADPAGYTRG